jgi:hypothetical protein
MNDPDLDLVRTLRADAPLPAPERVAAGRSRLIAATARPSSDVRRWRRLMAPAGIVTAAAAAAAVAVLVSGSHPAARTGSIASPAPHTGGASIPSQHTGTTVPMSLPAQVLTAAARKMASERGTRPAAGQWVYVKFFQTQAGVATQTTESWIRFDGSETAYLQGGRAVVHDVTSPSVVTPLTAYNSLADLPTSPAAIRAAVASLMGTTPQDWLTWAQGNVVADVAPKNQGQAEFDYLAQLLWNAYAAAPTEAEANVYQAMAGIPGVTVDTRLADTLGRPGIGVSANDGESWLILDPRTYRVIGLKIKPTPFMKSPASGSPAPTGTVSMAWAKVALVAQPGDR